MYYVEVSEQISKGGGVEDEHEEIEIVEMNRDEIEKYDFIDMKTEFLLKMKNI